MLLIFGPLLEMDGTKSHGCTPGVSGRIMYVATTHTQEKKELQNKTNQTRKKRRSLNLKDTLSPSSQTNAHLFFPPFSFFCISFMFSFCCFFGFSIQNAMVAGLDWVPMFWGTPHTNEFTQQLNAGAFAKCTAFLAFNEYVQKPRIKED